MTHSSLTDFCMHSPNGYFPRAYGVNKVTIHHMAGVMTAEQCGYVFSDPGRQASSNYGIGNGGEIACYVEEENAAWTSSSYWNDNQAITMEVSNDVYGDPWSISDAAWNSMIRLCADICTRYGIEPYYDGTENGTFTEHRMFAATGCPGPYIHDRMYRIVEEVKAAMGGSYGGGWKRGTSKGNENKWWYEHYDGTWTSNGWECINNKWYFFDESGWLKTGWIKWGSNWFYCQPETAKTGTKFGYMVTGWKTIKYKNKTSKFWFDNDGVLAINAFKLIKNKWYAFDPDGRLIVNDSDIVVNEDGTISIS